MTEDKKHLVGIKYAVTSAGFSKDPSTKVGACILRPDGSVAATGWNGFAPGVEDTEDRLNNRDLKYLLTLHAEENCILSAREPLHGYSLYVYPFPPCAHCMSAIIKSGIKEVIYHIDEEIPERWKNNFELSQEIAEECNILIGRHYYRK